MNRSPKIFFILQFLFLGITPVFSQDYLKTEQLGPPANRKIRVVERTEIISENSEDVFAFMDDVANTGMHMTENNSAMMGGKFTVEWLTDYKKGLGSKYRWKGKVVGMKMNFSVVITKWEPGKEKIWETFGEAKMIVISWYQMYLNLTPLADGTTKATLGIRYTKPKSLLGFFLGKRYSIWCVKSMLKDTKKHFIKHSKNK